MGILDRIAAMQGPNVGGTFIQGQQVAQQSRLADLNAALGQRRVSALEGQVDVQQDRAGLARLTFDANKQAADTAAQQQAQVQDLVQSAIAGDQSAQQALMGTSAGRSALTELQNLNKGPKPGTYEWFQTATPEQRAQLEQFKGLSRPETTVNVGAAEKEADKQVGKAQGQQYNDIVSSGDEAVSNMQRLELLQQVLGDTEQGAGVEWKNKLAQVGSALGFSPARMAQVQKAQTAHAMAADITLDAMERLAGSPSDADLQLVKDTAPQIGNERAANNFIIRSGLEVERRRVVMSQIARESLRSGASVAEATDAARKWAETFPMFVRTTEGGVYFFQDFVARKKQANPELTMDQLQQQWMEYAN